MQNNLDFFRLTFTRNRRSRARSRHLTNAERMYYHAALLRLYS